VAQMPAKQTQVTAVMSLQPRYLIRVLTAFVLLFTGLEPPAGSSPKLTADEIVARHLESIGPAAARASVKSRTIEAKCRLRIRQGGSGDMPGDAVFQVEGQKSALEISFSFPDYPREALAFDGQKVNTPYVNAGRRSRLADFMFDYGVIMREGLFGGVLSTGWPLLDMAGREGRLDYQGVKKIDGRELHQVQYQPKRGSAGVIIHLYFDAADFHHVMSIYEINMSPTTGPTPELSPRQRVSRVQLKETFSNFQKTAAGLTLPTLWSLELTSNPNTGGTSIWEWTMGLSSATDNPALNPAVFDPH
jgi:hypothetical protein